MTLWSIEKDARFRGVYFIWSGTKEEPLRDLHEAVMTLWGARFWIWRRTKFRKSEPPRSRIVFQVEA